MENIAAGGWDIQVNLTQHIDHVIDARKKPGLPDELIVHDDIAQLVDQQWREYFPT